MILRDSAWIVFRGNHLQCLARKIRSYSAVVQRKENIVLELVIFVCYFKLCYTLFTLKEVGVFKPVEFNVYLFYFYIAIIYTISK